MQKFRAIASNFGEFICYEHDRGARDIGMHLTRKLTSGKEQVTSALIWFQMKGIMAATLPLNKYKDSEHVRISLNIRHLQYWYLQPMPTYLVLYIEAADEFLILNISKYVKNEWGNRIFTLDQKSITIKVSKSILDEHAFNLILRENDINEWKKILNSNDVGVEICHRDYQLIWHLGTAEEREVFHTLEFWDWQSKTRGQGFIYENSINDRVLLREHLQFMMNVHQLEIMYPYLELFVDEDINDQYGDDDIDVHIVLSNGDVMVGIDCSGEYFSYECSIKLNGIGKQMFDWVILLYKIGLIEVIEGKSDCISIAPWHIRSV